MSHITFPLLTSGGEPYYLQLYRHILKEIQKGGLQAGEKLPSKRTLAQHLSVSVNTVDAAYQMLTTEGYLRAAPKAVFMSVRCRSFPHLSGLFLLHRRPRRPKLPSPLTAPPAPPTPAPFPLPPGASSPGK